MFKQVDYVMVTVSDMRRSTGFYRDLLGIELKFESPEWTEFQTGATTLALHGGGIPEEKPRSGGKESPAGRCSIGFNVTDLNGTCEELKAKGVMFVMPPTERKDEGIRLAVCLDPDGLPISLVQPLG
jgi:lactoylglutathione lyase